MAAPDMFALGETSIPFSAAPCAPRLLVLHHDEPRLVALAAALAEEGYCVAAAACDGAARASIDRDGPPDVLLTSATRGAPIAGLGFARACLARYPQLRVLYLTKLPWHAAMPLVGRERRLGVPFTATDLAVALTG